MKKRCVILFLCVLLCVCILLSTTGCGGDADPFEKTNELVVYCPPFFNVDMVEYAKSIFEHDFPDIKLTYKTFGSFLDIEAVQNFNEILTAELAAGRGPDLIIFGLDTFADMYKVMNSGSFYNLDNFLTADETFNQSDYISSIFDGGSYKGQRLFIPLNYYPAYVLAKQSNLEAAGISLSEHSDYAEWSGELVHYIETHTEEENKHMFDNLYPRFDFFLTYSGLQILDYETGEIYVDSDEFRQFMETFKVFYPYSCTSLEGKYPWRAGSTEENVAAIQNGKMLYEIVINDDFAMELINDEKMGYDTLFSFPSMNETKMVGVGRAFAAINGSSPNKANAYEFLKILLSGKVQDYRYVMMPIHITALALCTSEEHVQNLEGKNLSDSSITQGVEYYRNYSNTLIELVYQGMVPFFEDRESYEDCLSELKNTLELYLYE